MKIRRIFAAVTLAAAFCVSAYSQEIPVDKSVKKAIKKNSCVNDRQFSDKELLQQGPFANASQVRLVSYLKLKEGEKDYIISGIIVDGKLDETNVKEQVTLNKSQVLELARILY